MINLFVGFGNTALRLGNTYAIKYRFFKTTIAVNVDLNTGLNSL